MTEWRDVVGYEGLYEVSDEGDVKSKRGLRKQNYSHKGYLCKEGVAKYYFVHRLVAEAFVDNVDNKPYVNHIDEVKDNNNISNLEWCTSAENKQYSSKLTPDIVRGMLFDFYYGLTNVEIAARYGVRDSAISRIRTGNRWSSVTGIQRS